MTMKVDQDLVAMARKVSNSSAHTCGAFFAPPVQHPLVNEGHSRQYCQPCLLVSRAKKWIPIVKEHRVSLQSESTMDPEMDFGLA